MHYNPLKYVKTDTDILSFVNCFIMNTNPEGKSSGDPFWENAEKMLYTALIALLRDWFPAKDYNMSSLLTLLSLAEARENDENFKSALDLMFLQIEEGKKYKQNDGSSPDVAGNAGLSRSFGTKQADNGWSWVPSKFKRNSDGVNRYLTYSVTADTAEDAARQLSRIEVESSRILNSIGSKAHLMNGTQRLSVIHSLLNPYKPFLFDYQRDISAKRLQTTKDCIAPTQIDFRPDGHYNDCVKLDNGVYAQVLVMKKFGSELSDRALADMADLPIPMAITWYVQPMDKSKAINYVRTRSAWIDKLLSL